MQTPILELAEDIRGYLGNNPMHITSGFRCKYCNDHLKGASKTSLHLVGGAIDFYIDNTSIKEILYYCAKLKMAGKIKYYYTNNTNMHGAVHINI